MKGINGKTSCRMKAVTAQTLWNLRKTLKHPVSHYRPLSTSLVSSFVTVHHRADGMVSSQDDDGNNSIIMGQDGTDFNDDWQSDQNMDVEDQRQYSPKSPQTGNTSSEATSPSLPSDNDDTFGIIPEHRDHRMGMEGQRQYSAESPQTGNANSEAIFLSSPSDDDDTFRDISQVRQENRPRSASSSTASKLKRKRRNSVLGLICHLF